MQTRRGEPRKAAAAQQRIDLLESYGS
jgi:hypothetical protein